MNYEVYSYWNIEELKGVFNAVAALMNSSDFLGLLKVLTLVMILSLALVVLVGRGRMEEFWKWVIAVAMFHMALLVPKSNVILVDRTGTQPTQVVSNVPIGLAAFAHSISKIGDWLTRSYETVFSLPNDLQFQTNGMMFGQRVQRELREMKPATMAWKSDFIAFWRECIIPEMYPGGTINFDQLVRENDAFAYLNGKTNPALYVTLSTGFFNCPNAYNDLNNRLINTEAPTALGDYAKTLYPNDANAMTKASNGILASSQYMFGIATSALTQVKQAIVANSMLDAECAVQAQAGNTAGAMTCVSEAQGARATNTTYQALAKIAESSMPKLKSAIELVQYAIAPIILLIAVAAGHYAMNVLKTYVMSLFWIQLWPPLYAVVHYIMSVKAQALADATQGIAGSVKYLVWVQQASVSDQAVAGMLVMAIPAIAAALVKGGEVGLQAVAGMVSPPRTAEKTAEQIAAGNLSMGQMKVAPTGEFGSPTMSYRNADGSVLNRHADGSETFNVGTAMDRASFRVSSAGREVRSLAQQSEKMEAAAVGELISGSKTIGASIQRAIEFARTHAKEQNLEQRWAIENAGEVIKSAETAKRIEDNYLKENGVSEKLHAAIKGTAAAIAQTPELLNKVSPVALKATLAAELGSETDAAIVAKHAIGLAKTQGYSDSVRTIAKVTQSRAFSEAEKSSTSAKDSVQALTSEGLQRLEQASANYQRSLAYKELAGYIREGAVSIDQDLTTRVLNRLASERATIDGHTYNGFRKEEVDALMRNNNPEMLALVERLANEETEALLRERFGNLRTAEDVRTFFKEGQGVVPTEQWVAQQGGRWRSGVEQTANAAGVNPHNTVGDAGIKNKVNQNINKAEQAVDQRSRQVDKEGEGREGAVRQKTDQPPSLPGMAGTSLVNLAAGIGPSGTVWGADAALGALGNLTGLKLQPDASFWRKDADNYKGLTGSGTTGDKIAGALLDTALMGGGWLAGKPVSAAAGKLVGGPLGDRAAQQVVKDAGQTVAQNNPGLTDIVAGWAKEEVVDAAAKIGANAGRPVGAIFGGATGDAIHSVTYGQPQSDHPGLVMNGELRGWDDLMGRTWNHGINVLGGGQRPVPVQDQAAEGKDSQQKGDAPPPRER